MEAPYEETVFTPGLIVVLEDFRRWEPRPQGLITIPSVQTISPREEHATSSPKAGVLHRAQGFHSAQTAPQRTPSHFNAHAPLASAVPVDRSICTYMPLVHRRRSPWAKWTSWWIGSSKTKKAPLCPLCMIGCRIPSRESSCRSLSLLTWQPDKLRIIQVKGIQSNIYKSVNQYCYAEQVTIITLPCAFGWCSTELPHTGPLASQRTSIFLGWLENQVHHAVHRRTTTP